MVQYIGNISSFASAIMDPTKDTTELEAKINAELNAVGESIWYCASCRCMVEVDMYAEDYQCPDCGSIDLWS